MTKVLTVDPLLFGLTCLSGPVMHNVCRKYATTGGRRPVRVPTSAQIPFPHVIPDGAKALDAKITEHIGAEPGGIEVLAYSQGAQIVGHWLRHYPHAPNPDRLRFILIGNPERNGWCLGGTPTPTDTPYRVLDVTRRGDIFADPDTSLLGLMLGQWVHMNYWNVDLKNLGAISGENNGNTTYLTVP